MNRKGMSQTLALIVAASVLMMTALTVIFMVQGGLGDVFSSSNTQSCYSTIQSKCQFVSEGNTVSAPQSCERAGLTGQTTPQGHQIESDGTAVCQ